MVFSSPAFLHVFLPLTLLLALAAHALGNARLSNPVLLIASIVFYMWGIGASFIAILLGSIAMNYLLGLWVAVRKEHGLSARLPVILSVVLNLALLGYYKYANFFVAEASQLQQLLGLDPMLWREVILPIGISFFTFHSMSYVFDVAAGRAKALRDPLAYALYIVLFPQLVAGPIVRYALISEQLRRRDVSTDGLREGTLRFVHGLCKKVLIADSAGAIADAMFNASPNEFTAASVWLGAAAYTVQIYFDFSGYSDMAIGLARMLGFSFPENFNRPYAALSITDFWRRWHMTLSNWFRDYVYIPMGGSKRGQGRTWANLWTIFVLTGVWHGANWTFLAWGVYHGGLLVFERITGLRLTSDDKRKPGVAEIVLRRVIVLLLVLVGWVMFRAATVGQAAVFYLSMGGLRGIAMPPALALAIHPIDLALMALGAILAVLPPVSFRGPAAYAGLRGAAPALALMLVAFPLAMLKIASSDYSPFLYFQF